MTVPAAKAADSRVVVAIARAAWAEMDKWSTQVHSIPAGAEPSHDLLVELHAVRGVLYRMLSKIAGRA